MKTFLYTLERDGKCGLKTVKHVEKVPGMVSVI